ncbi:MAG: hypothetical protein M0Q91_11960 [Methanoregula sp.]|jgi:hypothetical protein|nr:hypothetical protein [Methanoregula sp.]
MVSQYPDTVTVSHGATWKQQTDGDYEANAAASTFTSECRCEPASSNPVLRGDDGAEIAYQWIVYMPQTTTVFGFGDPVSMVLANATTYTGTVKRQSNGQLNSRLWV